MLCTAAPVIDNQTYLCLGKGRRGCILLVAGRGMTMRVGLLLLALTVGGSAHAACNLDEKAATMATQVVTYLNACSDQPRLNDEAMLDVFFKLDAAIPDTDGRQCRQAIILRAAAAGGKLRNRPPADRKSECDALKASPLVQAGLRKIGRWQDVLLIY